MEDEIIREFCKRTPLSLKFLDCFNEQTILEAAKLATLLAQLGIEFNPSESFDERVSINVLKQCKNLFCKLGNHLTQDELEKLRTEESFMVKVIENLKQLQVKKNNFNLSEKQIQIKQENIEKLNDDKKKLDKSMKNIKLNNNTLEKDLLTNAISKNVQLKSKLESLKNELEGIADMDLSTEESVDKEIEKLQENCRGLYPHYFDDIAS